MPTTLNQIFFIWIFYETQWKHDISFGNYAPTWR